MHLIVTAQLYPVMGLESFVNPSYFDSWKMPWLRLQPPLYHFFPGNKNVDPRKTEDAPGPAAPFC